MKTRPNVIFFVPDEWRGDVLGHVGNPAAKTPHLDEVVAETGVSFANAFCQNPVCTPSRCSFMSGWYPHVRGHRTMYHMLRPDEPILLAELKAAGYRVWWGGKNDLIPADADPSFLSKVADVRYRAERDPAVSLSSGPPEREWRGEPGDPRYYGFYQGRLGRPGEPWVDRDRATIDRALASIAEMTHQDQPFAVYLALIHPHPPYGVPAPWDQAIERDRLPPRRIATDFSRKPSMLRWIRQHQGLGDWPESDWNELRGVYYGMCARMDSLFGELVDGLKALDCYDDTALLFFSDHGDFAGDYGLVEKTQNTFEDCLTRVPLIIKPPAGQAVIPGVRAQLCELVDLPATVCDLVGIGWPHPGFSRSLVPLLSDCGRPHRDAVFAEGGRLAHERQCMELASLGGQQPTGLYWPRLSAQRNAGPEHTKAIMCRSERYKYVYRHDEMDELYDLAEDPMESVNRSGDPVLAEVEAGLRDRVFRWLVETADVVPLRADARE